MKGFMLVEFLVILIIVSILALFAYQGFLGITNQNMSFGPNGQVETRCIDGYKFIVGNSGSVQQMLDASGGGVRCVEKQ